MTRPFLVPLVERVLPAPGVSSTSPVCVWIVSADGTDVRRVYCRCGWTEVVVRYLSPTLLDRDREFRCSSCGGLVWHLRLKEGESIVVQSPGWSRWLRDLEVPGRPA